MEKKTLPEELATVLISEVVRTRPIRLMFQDEARFGRMARIRRCRAPAPLRPVVCNGYERRRKPEIPCLYTFTIEGEITYRSNEPKG